MKNRSYLTNEISEQMDKILTKYETNGINKEKFLAITDNWFFLHDNPDHCMTIDQHLAAVAKFHCC